MPYAPTFRRVPVSELSEAERVKLLEAIVEHLGLEVEVTKWDGEEERGVALMKPRRW